jgi:hypothetical protein
VGPRASVFSPDKDGEADDVCSIVDTAGCRQAENKPLEARSSFPTGSYPKLIEIILSVKGWASGTPLGLNCDISACMLMTVAGSIVVK